MIIGITLHIVMLPNIRAIIRVNFSWINIRINSLYLNSTGVTGTQYSPQCSDYKYTVVISIFLEMSVHLSDMLVECSNFKAL